MTRLSLEELIRRLSAPRARELDLGEAARWAAVAAIFRPRGRDDWELLFIKRAEHDKDPWSGHMAFPGGRVEVGEDAYTAAIRETWEEVGLDLTRTASLLTQLDDVQAVSRGHRIAMVIRPFVFKLETHPELTPNPSEVNAVVWIPLSELLAGSGAGVYTWEWQGNPVEMPCVRYEGYLIWGLTHRMLEDLMTRLKSGPEDSVGPDEGIM